MRHKYLNYTCNLKKEKGHMLALVAQIRPFTILTPHLPWDREPSSLWGGATGRPYTGELQCAWPAGCSEEGMGVGVVMSYDPNDFFIIPWFLIF